SYADLAVTRVADTTLVALVSSDGAAEAAEKGRASVSVQPLDKRGVATGPSTVLTRSALGGGGVAIAAAGTPDHGAAVAWVSRDRDNAEVHVARVDRRGHRTKQIRMTSTKGDASEVAIGWADGGFIVAWIDARNGNGEVYATKLDPDLHRVAREERIT